MTSPDALSLWLAAGGVAGSALRALRAGAFTTTPPFFTRKSIADLTIGFIVGFLWPLYPLLDFPAVATTFQKAVIVAAVAYLAGDAILDVFTRVSALVTRLNGSTPAPPAPPPEPKP